MSAPLIYFSWNATNHMQPTISGPDLPESPDLHGQIDPDIQYQAPQWTHRNTRHSVAIALHGLYGDFDSAFKHCFVKLFLVSGSFCSLQSIPDNSNLQGKLKLIRFELSEVRVIGSWKQSTGNKEKKSILFFCSCSAHFHDQVKMEQFIS